MAGTDPKAPGEGEGQDAPDPGDAAQVAADAPQAAADAAQVAADAPQAVADAPQAAAEAPQAAAEAPQVVAEAPQIVAEAPQEPTSRGPAPRRLSGRSLALLGFFVGGMALGALFLPLAFGTGDDPAPRASALTASASASASASTSSADAAVAAVSDDAAPGPPPVWRLARLGGDATLEIVEGTVGKRSLHTALLSAGLTKNEAHRIYESFDGVRRLERSHAKDTFSFARERTTGRVVAFEYATSPFDVWQARNDAGGTLVAKKLELDVQRVRVAVGLAVTEDLRASIVKAGLDDDLLKMLDDALEGHAELSDLRPGARLRILATEERVEGAFGRYAELDAVEYFPPNPNAPSIRVYWYGQEPIARKRAIGGFYDAKGRQPYHGGWRTPVPFARISSRFNPNRMHPVLHVVMPHTGVDFAATAGTPIYATAAGTVTSAGDSGACGNMVMLRHANGLSSGYCHMSRFAAGLHVGQHVEARQLVGYVGATGRVTGPHLHFIVKRGDTFIDPLSLRLDGVRVLPPSQRDDFARRREDLDAALEAIVLPASTGHADAGDDGGENEFFEEPP